MTELERLAVLVSPDATIDATVRELAAHSKAVVHAGVAVVLDEERRVQGVVTDGDIRRAYADDIDFGAPVSRIMVTDPLTVPASLPIEEVAAEVQRRGRAMDRLTTGAVRHIVVTDAENRLVDIYDFLEILRQRDYRSTSVAVFGMGYVGLSLAVSLANRDHIVTGIDNKAGLAEALAAGQAHIHEPGLEDMLRVALANDSLSFVREIGGRRHRVYLVAVGTPLNGAEEPDLAALRSVAGSIAGLVRRGDLIMLRSTVPVGTTRNAFIPAVEAASGLVAGEDFHVAFTPERTVEGQAMRELRSLPQIIGGLTQRCARRAADFWVTLTPSVIQLPALEAAELIKLANNTFRDLSFGFANEVALLADRYNLNAFELIEAANEGYPRNPIPTPSPGVGGYCLTKDPILFGCSADGTGPSPSLGAAGRRANERAAQYPVDVVERFARRRGRDLADLEVLLVGLAFKGEPETDDMRNSVALKVGQRLRESDARVLGWDAVVSRDEIAAQGIEPVPELAAAAKHADVVLILNNHHRNHPPGLFTAGSWSGPKLIFDGWALLDGREIEQIPGCVYATMGYMTPVP